MNNEKKNVIYVTPFNNPYITTEIQIYDCQLYFQNLSNIVIIQDQKDDKTNLQCILENLDEYDNIIVYSVAAFGSSEDVIIGYIETILNHESILLHSFTEPLDLDFLDDEMMNFMLMVIVKIGVYAENNFKELLKK